jgi:hypothetical protein
MYHWSFYVSWEAMLKEKKKYFWCHRRVKVSKCVTSISILNWQIWVLAAFLNFFVSECHIVTQCDTCHNYQ